MPIDTNWVTANDILTAVNTYRSRNPSVAIGSMDHLLVEPTLVWVASEDGTVYRTWSIPLRLFLATISDVKVEVFQGQDDRLNIERRIFHLNGVERALSQPAPLRVHTTLEVVGYHESRQIEKILEPGSDRVAYLAPVSGSTLTSIDVRTPKGQVFRIPVDSYTLCNILKDSENG